MNKKLLSLALSLSFAVAVAGVSLAKTINCQVKSVEGSKVVMDCGNNASSMSAGSTVKVKAAAAKKAIEGC